MRQNRKIFRCQSCGRTQGGTGLCLNCGDYVFRDMDTENAMAEDARDGRREDAAIEARNRQEDEGSAMACNDHDGLG